MKSLSEQMTEQQQEIRRLQAELAAAHAAQQRAATLAASHDALRCANEETLAREREKSVLLSISEDVAGARNAVELLQAIREKAQRLIPFHDTGILIVEPDGEHHYDLAVNLAGWEDSEGNFLLQQEGQHRIAHPGSYVDCVMKRLAASNQPVIEDYEQRYREFAYPFFPTMEKLGYQSALVAPLKSGGKTFGTFWLNALEKDHFNSNQFEIFQHLADQVAVAVANILANEEILAREREKSVLLSISEDISTIRDKDDLFRVIAEKIKPIFGFDDAVVFVADCERNSYYLLLTHTSRNRLESQFYQPLTTASLPLSGSVEEWIVSHDKPFLCSTQQLTERFPDAPGVRLVQEVGIKDSLFGVMRNGGQIIGSFHLHAEREHFFQPQQLVLFQSVTEQLAVAVANILANEEILAREREKSTLLSISGDVAAIRERQDLFEIINGKVKSIFGFDEMAVYVIDADRQHYRLLYDNFFADETTAQAVRQMTQGLPMHNSRIAEMVFADRPAFILTREEMIAIAPEAGANYVEATGIENVICAPLKVGGQMIGCFNITTRQKNFFTEASLPLYQSVADQLAVAVANILANEEIAQLAEERRLRAEQLTKANEALRHTADELVKAVTMDDTLAVFLNQAMKIAGAPAGAVLRRIAGTQFEFVVLRDGDRVTTGEALRQLPFSAALPAISERDPVGYFARIVNGETMQWSLAELAAWYPEAHDWEAERDHRTAWDIPFVVHGEVAGYLGLIFQDERKPDEATRENIVALSNQMAVAFELTRLAGQAKQAAVLDERNRLAREIHDTLAQGFTGVVVQLNAADRIFDEAPEAAQSHVRRAVELAREGLNEARRSVRALRPVALEAGDLASALSRMMETVTGGTQLKAEFQTFGSAYPLDANASADLLRLGQEAVTNVLRHANARTLRVELTWLSNGCVRLRVVDDGCGFDVRTAPDGFGLIGMRERAARLGGKLDLYSSPGLGTEIVIETCSEPASTSGLNGLRF